VPSLAGKALIAARRYSDIAPDAPHALHMPSHTFTVWATGRIHRQQPCRRRTFASRGPTAEELHASDYQVYAYLQTAQDEAAALRCLGHCPEMASRFDPRVVVSGAAVPTPDNSRWQRFPRAMLWSGATGSCGGAAATRDAVSLHDAMTGLRAHSSGPAA